MHFRKTMLVTALFAASFGVRAEEDGAAAPKPEIKNLAKETCRIAYRGRTAGTRSVSPAVVKVAPGLSACSTAGLAWNRSPSCSRADE
jgi:hypothetical protein